MAENVVRFPHQQRTRLAVSPCPLCEVFPEVRAFTEGGFHATCSCPSCGAGSLPKGAHYAETKDEAVQSAIARWNAFVGCAYGEPA